MGSSAGSPRSAPRLQRTLTTSALVFLMYFNVSGGAFSLEGLVAGVGPGAALLILLIVPVVWAVPEALIIGELTSMLPEEGGYYRWVRRAFGPFWAFQNGWFTWLYSLVDMAIYPVLFAQYLSYLVPTLSESGRVMIALGVIWTATAVNLRGAFRVGRISILAGAVVLIVFLAVAILALPNVTHAPWHPFTAPADSPTGALGVAFSIALWNYLGWDNASTVAGETVDAARAYPRALLVAVPLVTLGYFVPLLPALGATDWTTWSDGSWPAIARDAAGSAGPALGVLVAVAGMISALALFNALLLAYSRIPLAMAMDGMLPASLAGTDARGTPRVAVLVSAAFYSVFALLPFAQLVVADVLLYALALALEFGALVHLRRVEPALRGPFRLPFGWAGVAALAAIPMTLMLVTVGYSFADGEYALPAIVGALTAAAGGPLAYRAFARR